MFCIFPRVAQSLCIHRSAHVCHTLFDAQFILWLAISRQYGSLVVILVSMDCTAKQTTLRMYAVRDETQGGFTETLCNKPRFGLTCVSRAPDPVQGGSLKPCAAHALTSLAITMAHSWCGTEEVSCRNPSLGPARFEQHKRNQVTL